MCGLVGYVITKEGTFKYDREKYVRFFRKGLYLDTLRGYDSTGVAKVPAKAGVAEVYKKAVPGYDFLDLRSANRFLTDASDCVAVMGHNRAATKGGVNSNNAHPFEHGSVTMMHNGTLTSMYGLQGKFDVDSEAICYTLSVVEGDKATKKLLEDLTGAFALVWHDSRDNSLNFARNEERPFCYQATAEGLLYASEPWIIDGGCSEPFQSEIKRTSDIQELDPGEWIKIDLDTGKIKAKKFTPWEDKRWGNYGGGSVGYVPPRQSGGNSNLPAKKERRDEVRENWAKAEDQLLKDYGLIPGDTVLLEYKSHYGTNRPGEENKVVQTVLTSYDKNLIKGTVKCTLSGYSEKEIKAKVIGEGKRIFVGVLAGAFRSGDAKSIAIYVSTSDPKYTYSDYNKGVAELLEDDSVYIHNQSFAGVDTDVAVDNSNGYSKYYNKDGKEITKNLFLELTHGKCAWCDDGVMHELEATGWYDGFLLHDECAEAYAESYVGDVVSTDSVQEKGNE